MNKNLHGTFLSKNQLKSVTDWHQAISAAESLLAALRAREKAIKKSLASLKKLRDQDAPFPKIFRSTLGEKKEI